MGHSSEGQCDFYQVHNYCYVRKYNHAFSRQGQLLQLPLVYFFRFLFMAQTHLCSSGKDTGQTDFSQWLETGHNPNWGRIQVCIKIFKKYVYVHMSTSALRQKSDFQINNSLHLELRLHLTLETSLQAMKALERGTMKGMRFSLNASSKPRPVSNQCSVCFYGPSSSQVRL